MPIWGLRLTRRARARAISRLVRTTRAINQADFEPYRCVEVSYRIWTTGSVAQATHSQFVDGTLKVGLIFMATLT